MNKTCLYVLIFLGFVIVAPARAFDKGGLADPACFNFYLTKLSVVSAKATSKNRNEYYFNGTGNVGLPSCDYKYGPYAATVSAAWDVSTGEASEQISHGAPSSPKYIVTHTRAKCPKDPWQNAVSCTLISQSNTHPGSELSSTTFNAPFPVSAAALTAAQRKILASTVTPFQDFTLPPNNPPVIVSPAPDVIIRNGAPVTLQVRRPIDGSESWYAGRALQFEVQFEVYQEARVSTGARPLPTTLGPSWTMVAPVTLIGTTTLSTSPMSVPLATFASRGPGAGGEWQSWRMRARLSDPVAKRPWSSWQSFFVVVPITFTKMPGAPTPGVDKAKPSAARKDSAPAPMPSVAPPAPMVNPRMNQAPLQKAP